MSTEFAGLCGIACCIGAGTALYLENSHFWTTEAIAAIEDKPQVVNRLRKGDRLRICRPARRFLGCWRSGVLLMQRSQSGTPVDG